MTRSAGAARRVRPHPDPVRIRPRRARADRVVARTDAAVGPRVRADAATEAASRAGSAPTHPAGGCLLDTSDAAYDAASVSLRRHCTLQHSIRPCRWHTPEARSASRSTGTTCDWPESSESEPAGAFDGMKSTGGRPGIDGGGSGGLRRVGRVSGSKCDSSGPVQPSSLRKVSSGSGTPESPPELTQGNLDRVQVSTTTRPACRIRP